jgi:signal transduction histidine kinase
VFGSLRTKLQVLFVVLGLAAIAATGWQASTVATAALQQTTYDRLTAVREMRASELERYFANIRAQVNALATDAAVLSAMEEFGAAWPSLPRATEAESDRLRDFYRSTTNPESWLPTDPQAAALQHAFLAQSPHPRGNRDLQLEAESLGNYSRVHARYHPTFHRYKTAFGYYDVFLIEPTTGRILYTTQKEIDLGARLTDAPYSATPLAHAYHRAMAAADPAATVIQDYEPYPPSAGAPAAFVAATLRRAGSIAGVLAIQIAIDEVNSLMDGREQWLNQGLGDTGQVYIVGPDNLLRSDLRARIVNPERYLTELAAAGVSEEIIERIRHNRTAVMTYPVNLEVIERVREGEHGTELGRNTRGISVLRSHGPLKVEGLNWAIVAEMETNEALAPVKALQRRIFSVGLVIAIVFFFAAGWMGASVTGPVLALASIVRRVGKGERGLRIPFAGKDEIAQLANDFNRMSDDLERTTVSKRELEALAGRLITTQEDERRRIARELHDDFTQRLAAASIEAGALERLPDGSESELRFRVAQLKRNLSATSEEVHSLSRRLHPALVEDLGCVAAIEGECRAVFERGGPLVNTRITGDFSDVARETQLALYRVTQEALRNVQRHSGAAEADLSLIRDGNFVVLEIRDAGRGFDPSRPTSDAHLGITSMEERARLLGGSLTVESQPGAGTTLRLRLPIAPEETK